MMYWEQSQFSKGKASLDGQRQGYTQSLWVPAKPNAGGTLVPAFRNPEVANVLGFSSIFDFCKQTSGPYLENADPAQRDGQENLSAQARERMCLIR